MVTHLTRGTGSLFQPTRWTRTACNADELQDKLRELDGMDHSWWCSGTFAAGVKRSKDSWVGTGSLAVLDFDTDPKRALTQYEQDAMLEPIRLDLVRWICYAHSTPHGIRIVGLLPGPIKNADEYGTVVEAMAAVLAPSAETAGLHLDPGSKEPWRAMFAPGARVDGVARSVGMVDVFRSDAIPFVMEAPVAEAPSEPTPARRTIGGKHRGPTITSEARDAWLADHPLEPGTRGECGICGHSECFQVDDAGRWFCYSSSHAADGAASVGRHQPDGTGYGDALDLAAHERGVETRDVLIADGYLKPPKPEAGDDGRTPILLPGEWWNGVSHVLQRTNDFVAESVGVMPEGLLYRRGEILVTLDVDKGSLTRVTPGRMARLVDRHAHTYRWVKPKGAAPRPAYSPVPPALAGHVSEVAPLEPAVDHVDSVVRHPVLAREKSGAIRICDEGYDRAALIFTLPHGLTIDEGLSQAECCAILEDLLVDYPFKDAASFQNAVALMVTMVVRPAVNTSPLFYVGASLAGTGKSKLVSDTISMAVAGASANAATYKAAEEEMRKYLESILLAGESFVFIDNIPAGRLVDSASLAAVLTMASINMRILGETRDSSVKNTLTLAMTGNNTRLSHELARRTAPIILVPRDNRPETRDDFVHPHARTYARDNRGRVLSAIISSARRWESAGCPEPMWMDRVGSYEEWRNVVGGILETGLGYQEAMSNQEEFVETSSDGARDDADTLAQLFRTIHGAGAGTEKTHLQMYQLAQKNELFEDAMGRCRSEDETRRSNYFKRLVMLPLRGTPTNGGWVFDTPDRGRSWFLRPHTVSPLATQVEEG